MYIFCIFERDMELTNGFNSKMTREDFCLADNATTHTFLKDKKYFQNLTLIKAKVKTIYGSSNIIEGSRRENFMLPKGTKSCIDDALYLSKSRKILLSFKDIRSNSYHIETNNEGSEEYLYIPSMVLSQMLVLEELLIFSFGLHYTTLRKIEANVTIHQKCSNPKIFMLWYNHLRHPRSTMMHRIIENSHGHPLMNQKILSPSDM